MELKFKLLEHPFYQAWTMGEVTPDQLAKYHRSYMEFIQLMPKYWERICTSFNQDNDATKSVIADETAHIELWEKWGTKLPQTNEYPRMEELINALELMTPSELLGAIHAFEIQQPEVAYTKKKGLLDFYGFENSDTVYFDDHMEEEEHIQLGKDIAAKFANQEEFKAGFDKGSELVFRGLDLFVN